MANLALAPDTASAKRQSYNSVNGGWPEVIPPLTFNQAKAFIRAAWKQELPGWKCKTKFTITSGNRYSWTYSNSYRVNVGKGWKELVHDVSHRIHQTQNPKDKPHADTHRALERRLVLLVQEKGFLEGRFMGRAPKEKAAPDAHDATRKEIAAIDKKLKRWKTKMKRAETAITKLAKRRKYYAKKLEAVA